MTSLHFNKLRKFGIKLKFRAVQEGAFDVLKPEEQTPAHVAIGVSTMGYDNEPARLFERYVDGPNKA
jgi:hypothetical protein